MGSFSFWHWLIVLMIIGGIAWLVLKARKMSPSDKAQLQGIGGWLALLAFGQTLGTLRLVVEVLKNFEGYAGLWNIKGATVAIYTEIAMNVALVALAVATLVALFNKKHSFVQLFFYQWLALPVIFILNILIVSSALDLPVPSLLTGKETSSTVVQFLAGGIWVWYTRVSVRVRNTMVN